MTARPLLIAGGILLLLAYPFILNDFWVLQVGGRTLGFGTIALSLVFLSAYVGMLSLAQMTVAGIAGYAMAYFTAPMGGVGLLLPWPVAVVIALCLAVLAGLVVGAIAVRTEGIYTLMITLAIAVGFYYLTLQNYSLFNGFTGFTRIPPPHVLGIDMAQPKPFFYVSLVAAALCYALVHWVVRTPFGLALQAARDNGRRLRALGYPLALPRIAAFGLAGFIAGVGGILNVWLNGSISPGSIAITPTLDVLMASVLGGMLGPEGAFLGAFLFTVVQSFAIYLVPPERFNTVIGVIFVAVVVFSPDGVLGLGRSALHRIAPGRQPLPGHRDVTTRGTEAPTSLPATRPTFEADGQSTGENHHAQ
jgi:branched-chain amino acid transport system permease protein